MTIVPSSNEVGSKSEETTEADSGAGHAAGVRPREAGTYTAASLSRLELSDRAAGAAGRAIELVAISPHACGPDPEERKTAALDNVRRAGDLTDQVRAVVRGAVVHAQVVGASWDDIAPCLGQTRQTLARNHGPAVEAWKRLATSGDGRPRMPIDDATTLAAHLDSWMAEHGGRHHDREGTPPVSGGLRALTPGEELDALAKRAHRPMPLEDLAALREREAVLWERIADGFDNADAVEPRARRARARSARAQASELRELLALRASTTADTEEEPS